MLALLVAGGLWSAPSFAATPDFIPGRLLVKPRPGVADADVDAIVQTHGARQRLRLESINVRVVDVPETEAERVMERLRHHPRIQFVERDFRARHALVVNDPRVSSGEAWHLARIESPQAWDLSTGHSNVLVAVLDSGVTFAHPDLAARLLPGYDFVNSDADPSDDNGHGTAVAGVVAANGNNGLGTAGVAFHCRILPVKVSDATGYAAYSTIARGINYAADQGARVINVSIAGFDESSALQLAANYAWRKGAIVIAAAGNESSNVPMYPAACQNVVAVSATGTDDTLCSFSNYGSHIAVAAPGNWIVTTTRDLGFGSWWGTSFASPVVAGVAALAAAANPSLSNTQLVSLLKQCADDLGPASFDVSYGHGRVNARRAVQAASAGVPTITAQPQSQTVTTGDSVTFSVASLGTDPLAYQWRFNGADLAGATDTHFSKAAIQPTNAGNYTVVVNNPLGVITSAVAVLTVTLPPPPQILGLAGRAEDAVTVSWSSISGRTYRVQHRASLADANWVSLTPDLIATNPTTSVVDLPNGAARRFYRVLLLP